MYTHDYLIHYGVEGMRWGIRRYQPYTSNPRKGGKEGKFLDIARKHEISSAKLERKTDKLKRKRDKVFATSEKRQIQEKINKIENKKSSHDEIARDKREKIERLRSSHAKQAQKFLNSITNEIANLPPDDKTAKIGKKYVETVLKDLKDSDFDTYQSTYGIKYLFTKIPQYRVDDKRRR